MRLRAVTSGLSLAASRRRLGGARERPNGTGRRHPRNVGLVFALLAYGVPLVTWLLEPCACRSSAPAAPPAARRGRRAPLPRRLERRPLNVEDAAFWPSSSGGGRSGIATTRLWGRHPAVSGGLRPCFPGPDEDRQQPLVAADGGTRPACPLGEHDGAVSVPSCFCPTANWLYGTAAAEERWRPARGEPPHAVIVRWRWSACVRPRHGRRDRGLRRCRAVAGGATLGRRDRRRLPRRTSAWLGGTRRPRRRGRGRRLRPRLLLPRSRAHAERVDR